MRWKYDKIFGLILVLMICTGLCAPSQVWGGTQAIDIQLTGSENDAEEDSGGTVTLAEDTLDLGGWDEIVGLRFTNVSIPKNAAITNAYIEFTTDGQNSGTTSFTIEGIASDNAAGFTDSSYDVSVRPVFSTSVTWNANFNWLTLEEVHQSPDITAIIQKLVDRDGWVSGNAMAFKIIGTENIYRRATSYDQSADHAPKLHIEYTANVIEVQVAQSTDDMYSSSMGLETLYNGNEVMLVSSFYKSGYRFQNVDIPEGAVINYAHIEFTASQDKTAGTHYMRFRGEKRLSPPTFSTTAGSSGAVGYRELRNRTATYRTWSSVPSWTTGESYQSADLKGIVQELVGQSGWDTSDKSMVFFIYYGGEQRHAWSYDGDPAIAPKLYIEYGGVIGDEGGEDTPVPVMTIGETNLGRSCWEGDTADSQHFDLINSGAATLNYTVTVTSNLGGEGWLTLNPAETALTLEPGTTQPFSVQFTSAGLISGTYEATITIDDPAAANNPQELQVSLVVFPKDDLEACGDIPLYTRNVASPAVLVLLDQSSSMEWEVDRITIDELPKTPDIANLVQEIVNQDGWGAGEEHNMVFFLENASGTGIRTARGSDGYGASAPLLHVEYNDGSGVQTVESRVTKSGDDGMLWATLLNFSANNVVLGDRTMSGSPSACVRFENVTVPQTATITKAYIEFVPALTESEALTLTIYGQHHENPPTFAISESMGEQWMTYNARVRTTESVTWAIPAWTGITIEKRIDIAKSVISELVKDPGISWGFGTWCNVSPYTIADTQITHGTSPDTWAIAENPKKDDAGTAINSYTIIHAGTKANSIAHQQKLQSAIDLAQTHTNTPFTPSLLAGYLYFEGKKRDEATLGDGKYEDGELFEPSSCQPKFVIEVTDGVGNVDPTVTDGLETSFEAKARENTAIAADAGITTVGIGFGLKPDEATQLFAVADESNAAGDAAADDYVYAIHPVVDGEAQPFFAETKEDLVNAFRQITNSVKGAVFHGSAPAATTSTDLGNVVVLASFDAATWNGDMKAVGWRCLEYDTDYPLEWNEDVNQWYYESGAPYVAGNHSEYNKDSCPAGSDILWDVVKWKASDNMPETRNVWTVDPATTDTIVAYSDDTLADDNYLCKDIGDIIHSTPAVVGAPPNFYSFDNYKSFVVDKVYTNPRQSTIYVGSNDGLLHAFNLSTGVEEWAFLPKSLQDKLNRVSADETFSHDMCSASYCHEYALDGSPMVADVYVNVEGQMQWRTMLVIGQREGGNTYTALDVTSGESFDTNNDDPARYLWEYSHDSLGETWSDPSIVRVRDATGAVNTDTAWGIYFGSGYSLNEAFPGTQEARIFALDAYTGNPLWSNGVDAIDNIKLTPKTGILRVNNVDGGDFQVGEVVTGADSGAYGTIVSVTDAGDPAWDLLLEYVDGDFQDNEQVSDNNGDQALVVGQLQVTSSSQSNDALASPLMVNLGEADEYDVDVGTKVERLYVGNLYGTMFRLVDIGKGQTPKPEKLFEFNPRPSSPDKNAIRAKAAYAYGKLKTDGSGLRNLWIYWGTGIYENMTDKLNREIQYFFGIKDEGAEYSMSDLAGTTSNAEFLTATVDGVEQVFRHINGSNDDKASWAIKLHSTGSGGSERVLTKALVMNGIVFFTTFIPDGNVCTGATGDTYLFAVDYNTGLAPADPVFDINEDGVIDENDMIDDGTGKMITPAGIFFGNRSTPPPPVPIILPDPRIIAPPSDPKDGRLDTKRIRNLNRIRMESWRQH